MTLRHHPAGQPARTRISHLVMLALLAGASGQAWSQTAPNLNIDPDFTSKLWKFEGEGGTITRITPPSSSGQPSFNEACIPVSHRITSLASPSWADNHFHLPNMASLEKDSLYRLSFSARWNGATARMLASKLVATVSGGGRANVYVDRLLDLGGTTKQFDIEFVTPAGGSGAAVHTLPTDIAFQAWSSQSGTDGANMCLSKVSLTLVRPNKEVMVPTTPVIRYNQVVTGPEDAAGNTYFTVVNPPVGSTVYRVSASGTSSAIKVILASDRGNDDNYGLPAVAVPVPFGSGSYKVQLRNGANTVLAETPMLTGTGPTFGSGPYTVRAPLLRRDALHFFYAQRAGEAIVDGRYPEYRNPFSREAGHVKEVAKCFSGVDNFGNDFSGACKTAAGRDPYAGRSPRPVDGGWYDAGDHGKYVVNGATALWALHNVIESHRSTDALNSFFPDGYLMHGTNGVSDLLDEAEYEMRWLLKMQIKNEKTLVTETDPVTGVQIQVKKEIRTPFLVRVPLGGTVTFGQDVEVEPSAEFGAMLDGEQKRVVSGVTITEQVPTTITYGAYSMKRAKIKLKLSEIDAYGMVFSAVRDEKWTDLPLRPSQDKVARVLDYPTTAATFSFAAVAAQCARIWKTLNPTLAAECSEAAKRAWDAALLHPDVYRYGEYSDGQKTILRAINEGGGAYADTSVSDARMWAAMELYLSESTAGTPDSVAATEYLKRFHETYPAVGPYSLAFVDYKYAQAFTWKHMKNMGLFSLLANGRNAEIVDKLKKATNSPNLNTAKPTVFLDKMATAYVTIINGTADSKGSAFGVPHNPVELFNWASNADIANQAGVLLQAYKYSTDTTLKPGYLAAARRTMSYLLGNNPLGKSYVTGYGTNPVRNPHHRFWAKHKDIAFPPAPPGMLVGGPNAKLDGTLAGAQYLGSWSFNNNAAAKMYMDEIMPNCMPEAATGISCYQDHVGLYMTNEVAINWNSALFWAVSFLK